ncbi:MAG: GMC family oxidoreductase N-terminal domain-containing protein, partial [Myxococcota bacterium]
MIRGAADVPEGFVARTDVCVVGSGAGGGVAAAVLAERGREVVVLEEGPSVGRERMTQREEQMYPLLYRDGGNQLTDDGGISVLQGRVVGGSTVVNMADVVGIPPAVLAHWRARFGVTRYGVDRIAEAEAACRQEIGANAIPERALNRNNSLLVAGGEALGLRVSTMEHNRVGCTGSGYCLVGCAYDAKRSVALTWIPRALRTERVLVQSEARVARFEHDGAGRVVAAVGHLCDGAGQPLAPFRVEADRFVLAAGAVHSPLVLRASGLGGRWAGRNLSLQPQAPVAALFPDDVVMFRGIPQAAYVDCETATEAEGLGGFRLEAISATPGMAAVTTALPAEALHGFMTGFRRMAANLCLVPDRPVGRVKADRSGRPTIRYDLGPEVASRLKAAMETAARCWLAAGAEVVALPLPDAPLVRTEADLRGLQHVRFRSAAAPLISAHPQGTCRMGPDAASAVVGLDLRVHGTRNLWVADASVFP